jgi:hypothetical protein
VTTPTEQAKEMARELSRETGIKVSPDDPAVAIALHQRSDFQTQLQGGLKSHLLAQEKILKSLGAGGSNANRLSTHQHKQLLLYARLTLVCAAGILLLLVFLVIA